MRYGTTRRRPSQVSHILLSRLRHEEGFREPIGVFRAFEVPRYDEEFNRQIELTRRARGAGDLKTLFTAGETWIVEPAAASRGTAGA